MKSGAGGERSRAGRGRRGLLRPTVRALDGAEPVALEFFQGGVGRARAGDFFAAGQPRELGAVCPKTDREADEKSGAEGGGLGDARADDGDAQKVALKLHERRIDGYAAVDAECAECELGVGLHPREEIGALVGDAFEGGARNEGGGAAARETDDGAARGGVPRRGAEADEGGNQVAAAVVARAGGEAVDVGGADDDVAALAEPLHDGAAAEHAALEGVFERALRAEAPGDRSEKTVTRDDGFFAGVKEQKATRAVGVLGEYGGKQARPTRAACWSPATPATGTPRSAGMDCTWP